MHIVDAQGVGHHLGAAAVVAGQQVAADVLCVQGIYGLRGAGLEAVTEGEQAQHTGLRAAFDQPRQGAPLGFPGLGLGGQVTGLQGAFVEQAAVAQG
ncbi:hypothetical protein D3C81_1552480 [compost metagenome]